MEKRLYLSLADLPANTVQVNIPFGLATSFVNPVYFVEVEPWAGYSKTEMHTFSPATGLVDQLRGAAGWAESDDPSDVYRIFKRNGTAGHAEDAEHEAGPEPLPAWLEAMEDAYANRESPWF